MQEISTDKIANVILMGRELARAEIELRAYIGHLTSVEQAALVAVMWIGRGVFEPEEWQEARDTAFEDASTPTADYLIGTPHLADHLATGLEKLGQDAPSAQEAMLRKGA